MTTPDPDWSSSDEIPPALDDISPGAAIAGLLAMIVIAGVIAGGVVAWLFSAPEPKPAPTPMKLNSHHMPEAR